MKFIAQRLKAIRFLFLGCSVLFFVPIAVLSQRYVSAYITAPYDLDLLGNDSCLFPIEMGTLGELVITGLISIAVAKLLSTFGWLRLRFLN